MNCMQRALRQMDAGSKGFWRFLGVAAVLVMSLCASAVVTPALASDYSGALSVSWDNDETMGSDNNYTHGGFISWATNEVNSYGSDSFVRKWDDFWSFLP